MSSPEIDVILCPVCGGVVGASEITAHGPPCTCFDEAPKPKASLQLPADDMPSSGLVSSLTSDPKTDPTGERDSTAEGASAAKLCVICGKDVSGHRRLKDSRGYQCLDCAKKESLEKKPQGTKCPKCFRVVKRESLGKFDGRLMCQRCLREAREVTKPGSKRFRKIDDKHFEEHSKTQLYVLIGAAVVLAIFIVVGMLRS